MIDSKYSAALMCLDFLPCVIVFLLVIFGLCILLLWSCLVEAKLM